MKEYQYVDFTFESPATRKKPTISGTTQEVAVKVGGVLKFSIENKSGNTVYLVNQPGSRSKEVDIPIGETREFDPGGENRAYHRKKEFFLHWDGLAPGSILIIKHIPYR